MLLYQKTRFHIAEDNILCSLRRHVLTTSKLTMHATLCVAKLNEIYHLESQREKKKLKWATRNTVGECRLQSSGFRARPRKHVTQFMVR